VAKKPSSWLLDYNHPVITSAVRKPRLAHMTLRQNLRLSCQVSTVVRMAPTPVRPPIAAQVEHDGVQRDIQLRSGGRWRPNRFWHDQPLFEV
jgi:hypothetical protein